MPDRDVFYVADPVSFILDANLPYGPRECIVPAWWRW